MIRLLSRETIDAIGWAILCGPIVATLVLLVIYLFVAIYAEPVLLAWHWLTKPANEDLQSYINEGW